MAIASKPRPREPRSDAARNHEALVRTATAAVHRAGPHVPMATIAAEAGVGIGTLYRHFPAREQLLNFLVHRSFEQVLSNVEAAERDGATASDATRFTVPCNGSSNAAVPTARSARTRLRVMSSPSGRCSLSPGHPTRNGTRHAAACFPPTSVA
ncbi:MAG TPA: TetR/AcrR family transcriptional regulator [Streptosporangiaceae bacterium]|nr:TetR/AcrR family transcriptional regulator [Streptosporangiaceae bacterium]